jgi:hypothetical protein
MADTQALREADATLLGHRGKWPRLESCEGESESEGEGSLCEADTGLPPLHERTPVQALIRCVRNGHWYPGDCNGGARIDC